MPHIINNPISDADDILQIGRALVEGRVRRQPAARITGHDPEDPVGEENRIREDVLAHGSPLRMFTDYSRKGRRYD
jgi:hypothetical protein